MKSPESIESDVDSALLALRQIHHDELLADVYPRIRDTVLSGHLAGGKPWEVFREWVKSSFVAACLQAEKEGRQVLAALQDPEIGHKVYLSSIVVAFLFKHFGLEDLSIKDLTAITLLIAAVLPKVDASEKHT